MAHQYRYWTTKEMEVVQKMWADGYTIKEISAALGNRTTNDVLSFISHQRRTGSNDYPFRSKK